MSAGTYLAPHLWLLWTIFGDFGSCGGFVVVFVFVMERAVYLQDNRPLSSFVQGLGYTVASVSPAIVGWLHQWSGMWGMGFAILSGAALVMLASGMIAVSVPHPKAN
ncbi:hypothetical protein [Breoghania sp.]|uniref:hypothetical protein n=1 Tax=Breoghania sp. TaxID=2065378 RepID=UPI0026383F6A|nr:hypothetical protein [Breoghania sp.]MDJ0932082.1 hypothetical protein [Breoghania sp.]